MPSALQSGMQRRTTRRPSRQLTCALLLALSLATTSAQHATHRLPPIPLDWLARPVAPATGIGQAHDAAATTSRQAQAFYDQGLAYLHSYVWIEAARSFNAALAADASLALAHVGLSVALVELSRPQEARAALDAARAMSARLPAHDRRHIELRTLQMAAEDAPSDIARLQAYRAGLAAAVAAFPQDVELLLARGVAESSDPADRGQGSTRASIAFYERALTLAPGHFAAHHYLAHAHENSGGNTAALTHSAAYAKAAASVPHARHMLGHNLRRAGRTHDAIAEFEAADRLHRDYTTREAIPLAYDWHVAHNLGLLGTSLQYVGKVSRAEAVLREAFRLPTGLLVQAYHKRDWPVFLRARGRLADAAAAAGTLIADPHPLVQATGQIELGFVMLAQNRWGEAGQASNAALKLLRTAPGGGIAANPLLALQGEFHLRTAARDKGRATLEEAARRLRAVPGPDAWAPALFTLEGIARAARAVGDWPLAGQMARQMIEHDPAYPGGHYALALAADHDGDRALARSEFTLALEGWRGADPDFPEAAEIRRRLRDQ